MPDTAYPTPPPLRRRGHLMAPLPKKVTGRMVMLAAGRWQKAGRLYGFHSVAAWNAQQRYRDYYERFQGRL